MALVPHVTWIHTWSLGRRSGRECEEGHRSSKFALAEVFAWFALGHKQTFCSAIVMSALGH
jgi:hypothetical protein